MIHDYYDRITDEQREFIDEQFRSIFQAAKAAGIKLHGDDDAERAVEALAYLVHVSNKVAA